MIKLIQALIAVAYASMLSACVNLPGSDSPAPSRYSLQSAPVDCRAGDDILVVNITKTSSGLDTDRIALRDDQTGAYMYLQDVRWLNEPDRMLQERLAKDLECSGYTVLTGSYRSARHNQLLCEIRDLNLIKSDLDYTAEVGLACIHTLSEGQRALPIYSTHKAELDEWATSQAVHAISTAYRDVFLDITVGLKRSDM